MQKKLIALAVAALASTGAMAQVTFYGVLDAGVMSVTGKKAAGDAKFAGIKGGVLSGNRLGFTAEEDLGGGLKALGRVEFGLDIDAAPVLSSAARQSFVGLSSDSAGSLVLGRVYSPGNDVGGRHDAMGQTTFSPYATLSGAANSRTVTTGADMGRVNNAIAYVSPKLGGSTVVKATVARNAGELNTDAFSDDLVSVGVYFGTGPLEVSAAYASISESKVATTDHTEFVIGASYNLGVAKVSALYISTEDDATTAALDKKGSLFQVGAVVPVGKGNVKVAVGRAELDGKADDATTFGIDYEHALGKRTTAFVGLNQTKVGDHTVAIAGVGADADESITAVAAGVRLTF